MAKIVYKLVIKFTVTYCAFIGTVLCVAAIVYLFIQHDGGASIGLATVGAGLVIGRAAITKYSTQSYSPERDAAIGFAAPDSIEDMEECANK